MPNGAEFIVAEVSKNWINGLAVVDSGMLCQQFETVINRNWERGYVLHSFELHSIVTDPGRMNETIVAVFRRRRPADG